MFSRFSRKKKPTPLKHYDPARSVLPSAAASAPVSRLPALRIFLTENSRKVMLIRNESDLQAFREQYGITGDIEKIY